MKRVLLLKAGDAQQELALRAGDYDRWFLEALGLEGLRFDVVYAHLRARLPSQPRDYDAVMMTGSPLSVTSPAAWMLAAGEWMLNAAEHRVPVLGVCFGHQLLGHLLGGRVIRNPKGREIGSVEVGLTGDGRSDPLFVGLPERPVFNATHEDILERLPPGATLLASNANTQVQAMAVGTYVRGVQFHPELSAAATRILLQVRAARLEAEARARRGWAQGHVPALMAAVQRTQHGVSLLRNFLSRF